MAGTRSSARLAGQQKSSPPQSQESPQAAAGSKRKSEPGSSPSAKRGRKTSDKKEQKTLEETMDIDQPSEAKDDAPEADEQTSAEQQPQTSESQKTDEHKETSQTQTQQQNNTDTNESNSDSKPTEEASKNENTEQKPTTNGHKAESKAADQPSSDTSRMDDTGKIEPKQQPTPQDDNKVNENGKSDTKHSAEQQDKSTNETKPPSDNKSGAENQTDPSSEAKAPTESGNAVESHARDDETPSNILEKGVIYFFFRGRVGIDNPSDVNDIARSYLVLRPIPHGAKLSDGPIGDAAGKCRLLALPKKVLPVSGKDRFMTFVEKSKTSFKELRDDFMSASDYATKTAGVQHTPPVTPVAEGVYAITTTGRESHLAYMLTIPQELGEVQKDMGLREQGSWITSAKNPQFAGPANTNLPQGPGFPQEILDEFRSLRWAPLQPKYLDYENCQFLLIGESSGLDGASDPQDGQEAPKDELEKLEGEDEIRIKHLKGDDAVFADLGINKKEYPQVPSTWSS